MQNKGLMLSLIVFIAIFAVFGNVPILSAQNNSDVSVNASVNVSTDNDSDDDDNSGRDEDKEENETDDDEREDRDRTRIRTRETFTEGNCTIRVDRSLKIEDGKRVEIIKKKMKCADGTEVEIKISIDNRTVNGEFRERIKYEFRGEDMEVETEDEIELEEEIDGTEYKLKAKLRNGNFTHIKIMPEQASEIALERLRALNFTVQLRERLDDRNVPRVVYNIETNQNGRFLGVFKIALRANAEVDPETGELLEVNVPWWAFLVAQTDEGNDTEASEITINLLEQNNSSESGTAILAEENGQVTVTLSTTGFTENVSQPAHIHLGSCPDVGAVQYPLTNVLNGESETTINITFAELESELPLAINVHKSVEEASVYTACSNLEFE